MPEQPAPGQAAYEVMWRASGVDVRWDNLDADDQRLWDDIAAAVAAPLNAEIASLRGQLATAHRSRDLLQEKRGQLHSELTDVTRERGEARGRLAQAEALLSDAADALWEMAKTALTVKPLLDNPYPDAPEWTPWTRWMESRARRAHDLKVKISKHLKAREALEGGTHG